MFHRSALTGGAIASVAMMACTAWPAVASASTDPHGLGLRPTPSPQASGAVREADTLMASSALPASVSLVAHAMPVGNQGDVGSCAAWATVYSALGYWENEEHLSAGGLEPMYTYSQVDGGVDDGSSIEGNLQVAESQGVDTQSDYWQGNFDYSDQPTAAEKLNAVNWKLSTFSDLPVSQSSGSTVTQVSIETALAAGDPVVIGIPVYENFFYVGTANNGYYSTTSGSLAGYHAITALGYNSQGLVIENSWGTSWGDAGYATLSWSFVNSDVFDVVSVGPLLSTLPVSTSTPTLGGSAYTGQSVTAAPGVWSTTATYAYQWESAPSGSSDWSTITGATSAAYTPSTTLQGDELRVVVTATGSGGVGSAPSAATTVLAGSGVVAPADTVAPTVSGTVTVGSTLSATAGTWSGSPTSYAYQWQRSAGGTTWTNIAGATGSSYVLTSADLGDRDRVTVTAANSAGSSSASSSATATIVAPAAAPVNTVAPALAGTAVRGSVLSASAGTWSGSPIGYAYQWQRSAGGTTWTNISGATGTTYTLAQADENDMVRVLVTATNATGSTSQASAATGAVRSAPPIDTALPTVSGSPVVGNLLTAALGTWAGVGNAYAYQWQRSANGTTWTNIPGATGATYTAQTADGGEYLRVVITASNPDGSVKAASARLSVAKKPAATAPKSRVRARAERLSTRRKR